MIRFGKDARRFLNDLLSFMRLYIENRASLLALVEILCSNSLSTVIFRHLYQTVSRKEVKTVRVESIAF